MSAMRGQSPAVKFEVASVKPTAEERKLPLNSVSRGFVNAVGRVSNGGRFSLANVPVAWLIMLAYDVKDFQITGGPAWAYSDEFEVNAKADANADFERMRPMLQALLAERFQLALHRETRELPVYELKAAKGGLKIGETKVGGCIARLQDGPVRPFGSKMCGGVRVRGGPTGGIEGFSITMPTFIPVLADMLGRTVVDQTGMRGVFDVNLEFESTESVGAVSNSQAPSIFTALQERMGLRLEPAKSPVEVLVIDHVERPSEN